MNIPVLALGRHILNHRDSESRFSAEEPRVCDLRNEAFPTQLHPSSGENALDLLHGLNLLLLAQRSAGLSLSNDTRLPLSYQNVKLPVCPPCSLVKGSFQNAA